MGICLATGASVTMIAAQAFTLAWTHSVEKTGWEEDWRLDGPRLVLVEARIKGSGAGMEPPDDARLVAGWWQYHPRDVALAALSLANAGGAAGRWRVCGESGCREIGAGPAAGFDLIIRPCRPDK